MFKQESKDLVLLNSLFTSQTGDDRGSCLGGIQDNIEGVKITPYEPIYFHLSCLSFFPMGTILGICWRITGYLLKTD